MIKSISPDGDRETDPNSFPWGAALVWVLVLVALMFGGTHVIEKTWGVAAALGWQGLVSSLWLVSVALWLALRGGGKRG